MRTTWVLAGLAPLAGPVLAAAPPLPPPLAPASAGAVQCYVPNLARKTCQSVSSYARDAAGAIQNLATALVSSDPPITMTTTSPVEIRDGRVCGPVRAEDIHGAAFAIAGHPADAVQTADLRLHVAEGMKSVMGHDICVAYVKSAGANAWVAKAFLDGVAQSGGDEAFIWVPAGAGWAVGP
jgi:hypothetical protein